ncbi:hypothetical protein JQ617_06945 [Bradyrhizobium sp. KB893862 SZCCT0404]|uniref:hypothetical protein n=1 Tax=Bradyrhizobium sp. KB893862 SZCCT0404 TaxID=2807672 RepID=UPI001BA80DB7|nr:hypothetical protein [Bradyrhizobium sp. KB893862 SZCCT0404]MBR1173687.1 hypothetical protein [Bradyrhizobium sp. KB893862 SZCCT0404]
MTDQAKAGAIIAEAIFDAFPNYRPPTTDEGLSWDPVYTSREMCGHLTQAILTRLDQAGLKVVPK